MLIENSVNQNNATDNEPREFDAMISYLFKQAESIAKHGIAERSIPGIMQCAGRALEAAWEHHGNHPDNREDFTGSVSHLIHQIGALAFGDDHRFEE